MLSMQDSHAPSPRRMPVVDRVSPALHGANVLAALRQDEASRLFGEDAPVACFVDRIHYGSRIGIVIDYTVRLAAPCGNERDVRIFGQLPWADVGAAAARAERKLTRQQPSKHEGGVADVVLIAEWGLLLRRPGCDERLDGLWLLEPRQHWSRHLSGGGSAKLASRFERATLLTHRFAKRAVLRLHPAAEVGNTASAIIKFYRRDTTAAQTSAQVHRELATALARIGADVAVPRIDAVLPDISALLMEDVPGVPLSDLAGEERAAAMAVAGLALARLHSIDLPGLPDHSIDEEIQLLRDWVAFTTHLDPRSHLAFTDKLNRVERGLLQCQPTQPRPIHRDYHERQILCGAGSATLIDFDTVRRGDPAQDVGNFLAHLQLAALLEGTTSGHARTTFMDGYRTGAASDAAGAANIRAHEDATMLRLALINWFNERRRGTASALLDVMDWRWA